jgi:twitching motility protein PilT
VAEILQSYRLRNEALQLRRFTAGDLAAAAKSTLDAAQKFINRLDNVEETKVFTKERLSSDKPGNRLTLYRLTGDGVRMLARDIAPVAREINELAARTGTTEPSVVIPKTKKEPVFGRAMPYWVPVFGNDLALAFKEGASSILIGPDEPAMLRVAAEVKPLVQGKVWNQEEIEVALRSVLTKWQSEQLQTEGWTAGAPAFVDEGYWGLRVKRQARGPALEFRRMPTVVPTIEDLYLPDLVGKLAERQKGLVLITGIGRSGRSRTMAAMIDRVNRTRSNRIITLEEPILYLHRREQSVVEQRQVALDVPDFPSGLDQAVQDTPEVLAVSDLSDPKTVATALAASEHSLVVGRVSSASPREAVEQLVSYFPQSERARAQSSLIANIAGIVSQTRLDPASGGDPVGGAAVLVFDESVRASLANDPFLESLNQRFEVDTPTSSSTRTSIEALYREGIVTSLVREQYLTRVANSKTLAVIAGGTKEAVG